MKKFYFYLNIIVFLLIPFFTVKAEPPFSSAEIHYRLVGKQEGVEDLYIKEKKMRSITTMKTPEGESLIVIDIMSISDGKYLTIIDLNQKIGVKLGNPFKKEFDEMTPDEINEFHRKMLLGVTDYQDLREIGNEEVLGKNCKIYEVTTDKFDNRLWVWNNLILKSEMTGTVTFKKVATDLKINKNIPDSLFVIPQEIEVIDRTET